jgi:hypothetical protein
MASLLSLVKSPISDGNTIRHAGTVIAEVRQPSETSDKSHLRSSSNAGNLIAPLYLPQFSHP